MRIVHPINLTSIGNIVDYFNAIVNDRVLNQTTQFNANKAFRDSFCSSVEGLDASLKAISVGTSFQKPPSEIKLYITGISKLAEATVQYMADTKIPVEENVPSIQEDRTLLEQVTKLQSFGTTG